MAKPTYCNVTTDLTDVFQQIEEYASTRFPLKNFEIYSTGGSIYRAYNTGDVDKLYQDGLRLTEVSAVASVTSVSKWYYDSTNDILYMRSSDSADPDTHEIEKGIDWVTFKTRTRNKAQDEIDGMLDAKYPRPLPQMRQYHSTDHHFDIGIVKACALLTCANILKSFGAFDIGDKLMSEVSNNEKTGIVDKYNKGEMRLWFETTPDELGKWNIEADSSNVCEGFIELTGKYGGSDDIDDVLIDWDLEDETWLIQIDGAGATGTAKFKWSRDNGSNWEATLQTTNYEWISLSAGISVRFWDNAGTFTVGDKWRAYMHTDRREDQVLPTTVVLRG